MVTITWAAWYITEMNMNVLFLQYRVNAGPGPLAMFKWKPT